MCSKLVEEDDMFGNFITDFEKFPEIFRDIVQKFNIIQYGSILSLMMGVGIRSLHLRG